MVALKQNNLTLPLIQNTSVGSTKPMSFAPELTGSASQYIKRLFTIPNGVLELRLRSEYYSG